MANVTNCALVESTLGTLDDEVMFLQLGEDKVEVAQVLRPWRTVNENVVEEYENKQSKKGLENLVHQCLKCRRCIHQAERHDQELEEAFMSAERHFVDIVKVHAHLVVAGT
jgi:hypothetical protein